MRQAPVLDARLVRRPASHITIIKLPGGPGLSPLTIAGLDDLVPRDGGIVDVYIPSTANLPEIHTSYDAVLVSIYEAISRAEIHGRLLVVGDSCGGLPALELGVAFREQTTGVVVLASAFTASLQCDWSTASNVWLMEPFVLCGVRISNGQRARPIEPTRVLTHHDCRLTTLSRTALQTCLHLIVPRGRRPSSGISSWRTTLLKSSTCRCLAAKRVCQETANRRP
jgi:hypothetical protein